MQIVEIMVSKKAADEGDSETARYLYEVAKDEARHAVEFALLLGKVKDTFKITGKGLNQVRTIR